LARNGGGANGQVAGGAGPDAAGAIEAAAPLGRGPSETGSTNASTDAQAEGSPSGRDTGTATSALVVTRLRCDLRANPLQVESVSPRLSWEIQATDPGLRGETQSSFEVLVASSAQMLAANQGDLWSSGQVQSNSTKTTYAGPPLASLTQVFWKARVRDANGNVSAWSEPAEWTQGLRSTADWGAQWIGASTTSAALPIFRREFTVAKPVQRAVVSVCGLGQYELRVNGTNVSDGVLEPGWTDFAKTCLYRTFDVTALLTTGANAMGILLGNGMYNVVATAERYTKFTGSFGSPKVIAHLQITFNDGTQVTVATDPSWQSAPGPITFTSIYGGEDFDARNEPAGWDRPEFTATPAWSAATAAAGTAPALMAQAVPPVKVMQEFPAVGVTQPQPGVFVYDLGQNFSGWPLLQITGSAGAVVRLTPGELLAADGTVSQSSMGGPIWFQYTLRGGGTETWNPRFAYTGFRYVQVDGAVPAASAASFPTRPQIASINGEFIHTSSDRVGTFTCSDPDVNKVHALILAAIQSNLQSILTDCPHREKLGWLEVGQLLGRAMMFNLDLQGLFEQEVTNMQDSQLPSGLVPSIAPEYAVFSGGYRDSPEWGSAYVLDPWNIYQMYSDSQAMRQNYAGMKRYVDYLSAKATNGLLAYGLGDWYDVGPAAPGASQLTTNGVTATGTLFEDATVLSQVATLLGNTGDASTYSTLAASAAGAYNSTFWKPAGYYDRNSQTANAVPLALGMVTTATGATALAALVSDVTAANYQVTAGEIGIGFVVPALANAGRSDVLLGIVKQSALPGYLYQLQHGATTLTEAWDANPSDSQNHAMFGHAERWFWEGLAGIMTDPSSPGFQRILIEPQMPTGIDSVQATYHSSQGVISSAWARSATGVEMNVSIPVNATATVYVPAQSAASITESGAPVAMAAGVTAVRLGKGVVAVDIGSGTYDFVAK
jgi:alpha-L-rhamnosidase